MSRYAKGRRYEWRARRELEARGYFVVRAAGSKGPVDLAAWPLHDGTPELVIQVKAGPRRPGPASYRDLVALSITAWKQVWWYQPRRPVKIIPVP